MILLLLLAYLTLQIIFE